MPAATNTAATSPPSPNAISTGTYWNFIAALRSDGHLMAIDQGCQGNVASFDSAATLWYAPLRAMSEPMPLGALAVAVGTASGARVRIVAAEPLAGDASTRRYVRLRLADDASPPTVVAMLFGSDRLPLGSEEIGGEVGGDELPFVNVGRYLAEHALPVPPVHHRTDTFLLLEDLGDTTLFAPALADPDPAASPLPAP